MWGNKYFKEEEFGEQRLATIISNKKLALNAEWSVMKNTEWMIIESSEWKWLNSEEELLCFQLLNWNYVDDNKKK